MKPRHRQSHIQQNDDNTVVMGRLKSTLQDPITLRRNFKELWPPSHHSSWVKTELTGITLPHQQHCPSMVPGMTGKFRQYLLKLLTVVRKTWQ